MMMLLIGFAGDANPFEYFYVVKAAPISDQELFSHVSLPKS